MKPPKHAGPNWFHNRKKRLREQAVRRLPELLKQTNGCCYWCQRRLVVLAELKKQGYAISKRHDWVYWQDQHGHKYSSLYATVDHVEPLSENLNNNTTNLVPACGACNRTRSGKGLRQCNRCRQRRDTHGPQCQSCRRQLKADFLASLGWDYWPDSVVSWWQHPETKVLHSEAWVWWYLKKRGIRYSEVV